MTIDFPYLGKYRLQECLKLGGIVEVWKAFDVHAQQTAIIKIPRLYLRNNLDFMTYFWGLPLEREAQVILSLQHPNIACIHGFFVSFPGETGNSIPYMVMDYIEGLSLAEYMRQTSYKGIFPSAATLVFLFSSLASAIDNAHQQGIIHGNLKPGKIMLMQSKTPQDPNLTPMLTDLGIVNLLRISPDALCHWEPNTLCYISPQQVKGQPPNVYSDLYALGVILYEMYTGIRPLNSEKRQHVLVQQYNSKPPAPLEINPAIPPAVSAVIMRSLAEDPAERYATAAAMAIALTEAFEKTNPELLHQPAFPQIIVNNQISHSPTCSSEQKGSRWSEVPTIPIAPVQFHPQDSSAETLLPDQKTSLSPPEQAPGKRSRGSRLRKLRFF